MARPRGGDDASGTPDARLETLLQQALDLPEGERSAFLDRVCGDDWAFDRSFRLGLIFGAVTLLVGPPLAAFFKWGGL